MTHYCESTTSKNIPHQGTDHTALQNQEDLGTPLSPVMLPMFLLGS